MKLNTLSIYLLLRPLLEEVDVRLASVPPRLDITDVRGKGPLQVGHVNHQHVRGRHHGQVTQGHDSCQRSDVLLVIAEFFLPEEFLSAYFLFSVKVFFASILRLKHLFPCSFHL